MDSVQLRKESIKVGDILEAIEQTFAWEQTMLHMLVDSAKRLSTPIGQSRDTLRNIEQGVNDPEKPNLATTVRDFISNLVA